MSAGTYKNMLITAAGTSGSRVLGFVRDAMLASFLGTGGAAAAFLLAFQLPNLFRRLLGEGALANALMPSVSDELETGGKPAAFAFFNLVVKKTFPLMLAITLAVAGVAAGLSFLDDETLSAAGGMFSGIFNSGDSDLSRNRLALRMIALTMPYMPLICMTAVMSVGLNALGKFKATSLTAMWLNVSMIASLVLSCCVFKLSLESAAWCLCIAVLVGGCIQFSVPAIALFREGWRPAVPAKTDSRGNASWEVLKSMFFPALVGAGITQFNVFFTRVIAFGVEDRALSVYHYANRLTEIPTGIFSASIFAVVYPLFARFAAEGDFDGLRKEFARGMRLAFAIILPAIVGIIVLSEPLVQIFFQRGKFTVEDTAITVPVVCISTLAVLFYTIAGLELKCLNSMKDARPQRDSAFVAFAANCAGVFVFTLWLGGGVNGLALANLISAGMQAFYLSFRLFRKKGFLTRELFPPFFKACFSSVLMGILVWILWRFVHDALLFDPEAADHWKSILCGLAIVVPAACAFYSLLMALLRYREIFEFYGLFTSKIRTLIFKNKIVK